MCAAHSLPERTRIQSRTDCQFCIGAGIQSSAGTMPLHREQTLRRGQSPTPGVGPCAEGRPLPGTVPYTEGRPLRRGRAFTPRVDPYTGDDPLRRGQTPAPGTTLYAKGRPLRQGRPLMPRADPYTGDGPLHRGQTPHRRQSLTPGADPYRGRALTPRADPCAGDPFLWDFASQNPKGSVDGGVTGAGPP
jgi:hypothetical protein